MRHVISDGPDAPTMHDSHINDRVDSAVCEHDWRVNPHVLLLSSTPRQQVACATCGAITSRAINEAPYRWGDVGSWPRA